MIKSINGKLVDIDNIELFERAEEGRVLNRRVFSYIQDKINRPSIINEFIEHYEIIYKSMPYPLYSIEDNVKYAAIATYIKRCIEDGIDMWIDEGLVVVIDENRALKMVGDTWGIIRVESKKEDNTDIELYKGSTGYEEYKWLLENILDGSRNSNFFKEFMPDFIEACEYKPDIMVKELHNMLKFENILSGGLRLKQNNVIDLDNKVEITLDIYYKGMKETDERKHVISLLTDKSGNEAVKIKIYNYNAYRKKNSINDAGRMEEVNYIGLRNLFNTLCGIRIASDEEEFRGFRGLISDGDLIYEIDGRVYICKAYKTSYNREIARGVSIYGYNKGILYLERVINLKRGIKKSTIFSYELKEGNTRLCKIYFTR